MTETQFDQIVKIAKARTEERDKLAASVSSPSASAGSRLLDRSLIQTVVYLALDLGIIRSVRMTLTLSPSRRRVGSGSWTRSLPGTTSSSNSPRSVPRPSG